MKHYEVLPLNGTFLVVENTPHGQQIIKRFTSVTPARKFAAKLNKGHGFEGWTPLFLLDKWEQVG